MKNVLKISAVAIMVLVSQSQAGGDLLPVTKFEIEDAIEAVKAVEVKEPKIPNVVIPSEVKSKEKKPWYLGVGLVGAKLDNGNCEDITYGAMAKAGYDFNEYVGVEARALKSNWEYEGAKVEHYGAFLKPQYPITEAINLYGLVGYAKTKTGKRFVLDENGLAFGGGVDYDFGDSEAFSLFVDYERLLQKSKTPDLDAVAFGFAYKF